MVLLADTVLHDPKYANTKGTVEIPLPENLSKLTKGKPLRVEFPEQRKDSCQVCFFRLALGKQTLYCAYESNPNTTDEEYFGNIRKNFHIINIKD